MPHPIPLHAFSATIFLLLFTITIPAQTTLPITKFFSARSYDRYQGTARTALVQELQDRDWQALDSIYGMPDQDGIRRWETAKTDLAPYVNNDGYIVYWVPEVSPQFPGGETALQQYENDVVFPRSINPNGGRRGLSSSAIYIRCMINSDGQVTEVAEAVPHREWVSAELVERCVDAVRYMPPWSPGLFHGKPVRVNKLIVFTLAE